MTIQITKPETPKVRKQLVERPNIQTLSLKAIVADAAFQPRVETDPAHVLTFDELIANGHPIHPVDVFWTGEKYVLVDGFHRYHAHVKRLLASIQAVVHLGSERDAMIFAAGANKLTIKALTAADRKKAVMMLLEDEEWREKSDHQIAKHTGIGSQSTVRKYKVEFAERKGLPIPQTRNVLRKHGRKPTKYGAGRFVARVNGKHVQLGADQAEAEKMLNRIDDEFQRKTEGVRHPGRVALKLSHRNVFSESVSVAHRQCRIGGYYGHGFVFESANFNDVSSVRDAILNVLLVRGEYCGGGGRAIVLGYLDVVSKNTAKIIELAKPLGVEFMTPEEFIDSFAATDESAPTDEPMLD